MTVLKILISFGCLFLATKLSAQTTWLTVAGNPGDASTDLLEVDPKSRVQILDEATLNIRVSRNKLLSSSDGIPFRSYTATIRVNCLEKTARFATAAFHMMPFWEGTPHRVLVFTSTEIRPVIFRFFEPNPTARVVKAACISPGK